jgi:hypothetical protein
VCSRYRFGRRRIEAVLTIVSASMTIVKIAKMLLKACS